MIKIAKETPESEVLLVFDVRDKAIALETFREPKVYLGKFWPSAWVGTEATKWRWESAWGGSCGEVLFIEDAPKMIEICAKGMYR